MTEFDKGVNAGMRIAAEIAQGFMREHGGSLTDARSTLPQRIHDAIIMAIPSYTTPPHGR